MSPADDKKLEQARFRAVYDSRCAGRFASFRKRIESLVLYNKTLFLLEIFWLCLLECFYNAGFFYDSNSIEVTFNIFALYVGDIHNTCG